MLRVAAGFLAVMALTACGGQYEDGIDRCEADLISGLKAPSTYKRINAQAILITEEISRKSNEELRKMGVPEGEIDAREGDYLSVNIEYDASNSFGVPLRDTRFCRFPMTSGKPDYDHMLK
jgi:hypothetical protein